MPPLILGEDVKGRMGILMERTKAPEVLSCFLKQDISGDHFHYIQLLSYLIYYSHLEISLAQGSGILVSHTRDIVHRSFLSLIARGKLLRVGVEVLVEKP